MWRAEVFWRTGPGVPRELRGTEGAETREGAGASVSFAISWGRD